MRLHVRLILRDRHRRDPDVVALLQEEQRAPASGVGDAVLIRRSADARAAEHLALMRLLDRLENRRLIEECAKLDPDFEKSLAEEGMAGELDAWPEY